MQHPTCTDDYGTSVYRCRYTSSMVWADACEVIGSVVPGVKARYVIAPTIEARHAHKASGIAFHESERNCNTCLFLSRVPHAKSAGFLHGRCTNAMAQVEASPYFNRMNGDVMVFHPDDPMHMPCYESRFQHLSTKARHE